MRLILASASPRRRLLLQQAGFDFEVDPSSVIEPEPAPGADPAAYAAHLAWLKAADVARRRQDGLILGADTVCDVGGVILNKPRDRADAEAMIRHQFDRQLEVLTALCLFDARRWEWRGAIDRSLIHCRALTEAELAAYLDSGDWQGKAGGYGVQDDDPFVTVISGSWSNVVGLPLERLREMLADAC